MKCYKCGAEVPSGKMSCDNCGAMIFSNTAGGKDVNAQFTFSTTSQRNGSRLSLFSMLFGIVSWITLFLNIILDGKIDFIFFKIFSILIVTFAIISIIFGVCSLSTNRNSRRMAIVGLSCGIIIILFYTIAITESLEIWKKDGTEYRETIDAYEEIIHNYQEYYK